jgi:hypothetical protein
MIDSFHKQPMLADLRYLTRHPDQTLIYPVSSPVHITNLIASGKDRAENFDDCFFCSSNCITVIATGIIVAKKIAISFIFFPIDSSN